jgi:hypothetical protein
MKKYIITLNDKVYEVEMEEVIELAKEEVNTITKSSRKVQEEKK